jgi:hypothetical protein
MNPFYEEFKQLVVGGGSEGYELGDVYRGVMYQRGYGLGYATDYDEIQGLGFADGLMRMFKFALPALKSGLQYLGKQAVSTAANIAQDAISGRDVKEAAMDHVAQAGEHIFAKAPTAVMDHIINNKGHGVKRKVISHRSAGEVVTASKKPRRKQFRARIGKGLLNTYPVLGKLK